MSEPFIGEIKMFGGNFAPRGFAFCNGQLLAISQNSALFSLLGTMYGGDGRTTFGLPELRGRIPIKAGSGPGLTPRSQGYRAGAEQTTLSVSQIPSHSHGIRGDSAAGSSDNPTGNVPAKNASGVPEYSSSSNRTAGAMIANSGGSQGHNNMMPWLGINYIIALQGIYPSRS